MKRILSLFDFSGAWGQPFADNGWDVIAWDIKREEFMDINLLDSAETVLDMFEDVDGILAAAPCTDFASSGAQYWKKKDLDGRTKQSVELVNQVFRLANLFKPSAPDYDGTFFWALENPVGRLNTLFPELEKPYYFNPCDFAGYLEPAPCIYQMLDIIRYKNGIGVTNEENEFVIKWNAYNKRTGLWGEFNRNLIRKPITAVKTSAQGSFTQRLGGKSAKTKEERSITPEGFAQAFYEANKDHKIIVE